MITNENFKALLEHSDKYELYKAINKEHGYILIESVITNTFGYMIFSSKDYDSELAMHYPNSGHLFGSKEDILRLIDELTDYDAEHFLQENDLPLAILDCGTSQLYIYDAPAYLDQGEEFEQFIEGKGINSANCHWAIFNGVINDERTTGTL